MNEQLESRLLKLAGVFLLVFSVILTLSPAVRERSWQVDYKWSHWIGLVAWLIAFRFTQRNYARLLPDRDPYLLPVAALLTGWGLLTVWRLTPEFGLRQTIWMLVTLGLFSLGPRFFPDFGLVRRYKYILLACGLFLTALTLFLGSNPAGTGPRLWLGCCGIYFQPSEPLKLLFVAYLASYLADRLPARNRLIPLLFPTLFVTGLALLLLFVQRDLGTASIFILIYSIVVYIATGYRRALLVSASALTLAGVSGYFLVGVIRLRIEAWLNPWADPSGRAYQIVQSLLAIANGGVTGRGPGLGSPSLVPIAHSDFIFTAIAEETGLAGVIGLLALTGLLVARSLKLAMLSPDRFRRLLAAGVGAYFSVQSLLIIGGNLRILPLTGVTLPFVSYGGSSLLTSFTALFALMLISNQAEEEPAPLPRPQPYYLISGLVGLGLVAMALGVGWWGIIRGPDLLTRTDNARRSISDRYVQRGALLDRNNIPLNLTEGQIGDLTRVYYYPALGPVFGYTHPIYGQAGLEASLDDYLRGLQGNPASLVWWHHVLYGTPPPGLDVRTSIDVALQAKADSLLGAHTGAVVLLNAGTGEILAMASHPGFDPGDLDEQGPALALDENAPLLNRATLGRYPPGNATLPFLQAWLGETYPVTDQERTQAYQSLGFYSAPLLRMPVALASRPDGELRVSPLQMALAASALSADGVRPPPRIALAVDTTQQGWVVLPALDEETEVFSPQAAKEAAQGMASSDQPTWEFSSVVLGETPLTWHLAGTLPDWKGAPLALVVLLEENDLALAQGIASEFLRVALSP
ncbi:MAG: FtsW/RodA/SpoVE family cell cycle protein [Chloroflexota bacterium]